MIGKSLAASCEWEFKTPDFGHAAWWELPSPSLATQDSCWHLAPVSCGLALVLRDRLALTGRVALHGAEDGGEGGCRWGLGLLGREVQAGGSRLVLTDEPGLQGLWG